MKLVKLTEDQKWDDENEIEIIKCPVCGKSWYSEGEYSECSHLRFVLCTYDDVDFMFVSKTCKKSYILSELNDTASDYNNCVEEMDYDVDKTIEDVLLAKLPEMVSPEVTHCLVDEYIPVPPEMTYFITLFGYQE